MVDESTDAGNWLTALKLSKADQAKWVSRSEKIVKRYRDERDGNSGEHRYNILWSNVRTIFPAIYAKKPNAQVERRFKDADPIGRCASEILERCLQFEIEHCPDFDGAMRSAVLDRLLPGRGVAWVRFEPGNQIPLQITDDVADGNESSSGEADETAVPFSGRDYDYAPVDYVFWQDFRASPARTWEEVTWVARRVYMSREEGVERFGDAFKLVPLAHEPIGLDALKNEMSSSANTEGMKKAKVWEIWDKAQKKVIWVVEDYTEILDTKDDPLELEEFFPCPKPLFSTVTTDTIIPIPDYVEYQDQANEMDVLTQRIAMLVKAVKVVGVYDASASGVQRMLNEGTDNTLIPVDTWAAFAEKGGVQGSIQFLPIVDVVAALQQLYAARDACKQVIYEVTGLSDIIRGSTAAQETATAQQIKSNFASIRLKESIADIARFASDILRIKGQMMCNFYSPESLVMISGVMQTPDAPHAQAAIQLLKSGKARDYRIDIAADSMVELDELAEKQSRMEFLTAAGTFIEKAVQGGMAVPALAPLLGEMMMFGVRSFKGGRTMEASFERAVQALSQPQPPKPNPAMQEAQMKMQAAQAELQVKQQMHMQALQAESAIKKGEAQNQMQIEQMKVQAQLQIEQMKAQAHTDASAHKAQVDIVGKQAQAQVDDNRSTNEVQASAQLETIKHMTSMEFERWKAELEAATKIEVANIASKAKIEDAATATATAEIAAEVKQ